MATLVNLRHGSKLQVAALTASVLLFLDCSSVDWQSAFCEQFSQAIGVVEAQAEKIQISVSSTLFTRTSGSRSPRFQHHKDSKRFFEDLKLHTGSELPSFKSALDLAF